jgi:hypothetical protein
LEARGIALEKMATWFSTPEICRGNSIVGGGAGLLEAASCENVFDNKALQDIIARKLEHETIAR